MLDLSKKPDTEGSVNTYTEASQSTANKWF